MPPETVRRPRDIAHVSGLHVQSKTPAEGGDEQWDALLGWLRNKHGMDVSSGGLLVERRGAEGAGKGLFAIQSCARSTALFTIPAGAMINLKTLSPLYPGARKLLLTANQMITLHLVLHRPEKDSISRDPNWGPYLSTLPREFSSHPMTWAVRNHFGLETALEKDLLSLLPSAVMSALGERVCRFAADWKAICSYVAMAPGITSKTSRPDLTSTDFRPDNHLLLQDCLWAWLNVNTRCVYYQLDPSSLAPENLTLCPVLDFANHRPHDTHIIPVSPSSIFPPTPGSSSKGRHGLGGDYTFMASSETPVHQDEELFLRYGGHSNRMLFVEYGFVNLWNEGECTGGQFDGEVDVQDMMEELFVVKGATGGTLKDALEEEGYWGDWTMHSQPTPAHPSYRLVSALRLLHAAADDATEDVLDRALEQWRAVLWGQVEQISEENEKAWRNTLPLMCQRIARKARAEIQSMQRHGLQPNGLEDPAWKGWMLKNIDMLWREEYEVAEAVGESVRVGVDF